MKEELEKELKELYRIDNELNDAKKRLVEVVSEILENYFFPTKIFCELIPHPVEVDDDKQSYIGIIVSIESDTIDMDTLLSIKEAVGAVKIKVLSLVGRPHLGEKYYPHEDYLSHIELNIFFPHV